MAYDPFASDPAVRVHVEADVLGRGLRIYFVTRLGLDRALGRVTDDGRIEFDVIPAGQTYPAPTLTVPDGMVRAFVEALIEAVARPPDQSKVEGQLEATRYHLEDLRALLQLKKS